MPRMLLNTATIELWPAPLLRARSNRDARVLAHAVWVLRRKRDGGYLAAVLPDGLMPLTPRLGQEPGLADALAAIPDTAQIRRLASGPSPNLPMNALGTQLHQLGLEVSEYSQRSGLSPVAEPAYLHYAGRDRYRRPLWLQKPAARAWQRLAEAARQDGIALQAISGYRSHAYQVGIFERKLARGLSIEQILAVNAAPGYSEHHGGCALDIGTPGEPPAESSFEATPAFAWLCRHAADFGFQMSYPPDNPHGIVYEPWHWCWHGANR